MSRPLTSDAGWPPNPDGSPRATVEVELLRVPGYPDTLVLPDGTALDVVRSIVTHYEANEQVRVEVEFWISKDHG